MTELECLSLMKAPGDIRPGKSTKCVIQILVTSSCTLACSSCTQASNLRRPHWAMTPEQFEAACKSLSGYQHVVGVFGGCPTISKHFPDYCRIIREHFPRKQCGIWANDLLGHGPLCRETFNPSVSNLNVHGSQKAYDEIRRDWPEARPFGLTPSSHSPVFASMIDLKVDEPARWELISQCTINQFWSAGIGVFRGDLRAWFCEIAMSQSLLKQHDTDYPDTGTKVVPGWWQLPMTAFAHQVRTHCHHCSVPLRGKGSLDSGTITQISKHYPNIKPKRGSTEIVTTLEQLQAFAVDKVTEYRKNATCNTTTPSPNAHDSRPNSATTNTSPSHSTPNPIT